MERPLFLLLILLSARDDKMPPVVFLLLVWWGQPGTVRLMDRSTNRRFIQTLFSKFQRPVITRQPHYLAAELQRY